MKINKKMSLILTMTLIITMISTFVGGQNVWYISADVNQSGIVGDGSINNPWNLRTGFEYNNVTQPGEIIYLRGGIYNIYDEITSYLQGNSTNPIIVRVFPGEHATIDLNPGSGNEKKLLFYGQYTHYFDFEVMNSGGSRMGNDYYVKRGGIGIGRDNNPAESGKGVKLINFIIHDLGNAVYTSHTAVDNETELYGCIIYNNGWDYDGSSHGHGIYTRAGKIYDNVVFNQFGYGVHARGGNGPGLEDLDFRRNIIFNNGTSSFYNYVNPNFLIGEGSVANNANITENHLFFSSSIVNFGRNNVKIEGDGTDEESSFNFCNNYVTGGSDQGCIRIDNWYPYNRIIEAGDGIYPPSNPYTGPVNLKFIFRENMIIGTKPDSKMIFWGRDDSADFPGMWDVDYNIYFTVNTNSPFSDLKNYTTNNRTFTEMQDNNTDFDGKFDINGIFNTFNKPYNNICKVYPNKYESGRANIVFYRWDNNTSTFNIDASQMNAIGINNGDKYVIYNAQNFFGTPVVAETRYNGGSITVPILTNSNAVLPLDGNGGYYNSNIKSTAPDFNVYVIRKHQCYTGLPTQKSKLITGTVVWSTPLQVTGDIIIAPNSLLAITSTVKFDEGVSITVKAGGKLIVEGGVLTNACVNKLWDGIFVEGKNLSQTTTNQGAVQLNNATVENAVCGVRTSPWGYALPYNGGIILANNTIFRNNVCAVDYFPYIYSNVENVGVFIKCTFTVDNNNMFGLNNKTFINHVRMYGVNGVKFKGCIFENSANLSNGIGINALNSGFYVMEYCSVSVINDCPCPTINATRSTFDNLAHGISASVSGVPCGITIDQSSFSNNSISAEFNSYNYFQFTRCEVKKIGSIGLKSSSSSGYRIEENIFSTLGSIGLHKKGIDITNSSITENKIYKNTFSNLYNGVLTNEINGTYRVPRTGLQFLCNQFEGNIWDIKVEPNSVVRPEQGSIDKSADNIFINTNNSSFDNAAVNLGINYFYSNIPYYRPINPLNITISGAQRPNICGSTFCLNNSKSGTESTQDNLNNYIEMQNELDNLVILFEKLGYTNVLENIENGEFSEELIIEVFQFLSNIDKVSDSMRELSDNSIRTILLDSILDIEYLKSWYEIIRTPIAKYLLAETELFTNNYERSDAVLRDIPEMFVFEEPEIAEHENYLKFHNLKKQLQLEGRSWDELNDNEILNIQRIAEENKGRSSSMVKGVLCFFFNICYEEEILYEEPFITPKSTLSNEEDIIISETSETVNFENVLKIEVYNMAGQLIFLESPLSFKEGQRVSSLPSGIYVAKIYSKDAKVSSNKFIKK